MDQTNLDQSGIYAIINRSANRVYVGSANCVRKRFDQHRRSLRQNKHSSRRLQNSWNKHGEGEFSFWLVEAVPDKSKLIEREQLWINGLFAAHPELGYNLREVAGSMLGYKHSPETRLRMSLAHLGKKRGPISKEHQRKMCEAAARVTTGKRKVFSPEHCAKLREAQLKKAPPSAKARANMSKAQRRNRGLKAKMAKVRMAKKQLSFKFT